MAAILFGGPAARALNSETEEEARNLRRFILG
jgi:hypothetical protein